MKHPVKPSMIDTLNHYYSMFGNYQTEEAARILVLFAKHNNDSWNDFTMKELVIFRNIDSLRFNFRELMNEFNSKYSYIIKNNNDTYSFTNSFIAKVSDKLIELKKEKS